jgi:hypothetical protein
MRKVMMIVLVSLAILASDAQAFDKAGIQPPSEIIFDAQMYCASMVRLSERLGDLETAANWCDNIVALKHLQFAYNDGESGVWYNNVYVWADKYRNLEAQKQGIYKQLGITSPAASFSKKIDTQKAIRHLEAAGYK